jgi:hypothetical protein
VQDKYAMSKFSLRFGDPAVEQRYVDQALNLTRTLCRLAWIVNIVVVSLFALMDDIYFPDDFEFIRLCRALVIAASLVMLASTFLQSLQTLYKFSSAAFIILVGSFSSIATGLGAANELSPYFFGLFIAFTGVFIQAGIGLTSSIWAMVGIQVFFIVVCNIVFPVSGNLLLTYAAFLPLICFICAYDAYMIEKAGRDNFVISACLEDSLAQVKALSGLLPICASCKSIRDDKGYWAALESYFSDHSDVQFSHGICPSCIAEQYSDFVE